MRGRLVAAGYRSPAAPVIYAAAQIVCALVACVVVLVASGNVGGSIFGLIAGFNIPSAWLTLQIKKRTRIIRNGLPDVVDLLIVCLESGCGLDQATLRRVFEPFFTTKEVGKGTGLGLSTVHGIVHQTGGHIGVDSTVGRGTTFTIYLPCIEEPAAEEAPDTVTPLVRGSETLLLVEDEEEVRRLAADVLKKCGYAVLATGDPLEALL